MSEEYTGTEELEILKYAKNYNSYLFKLIKPYCKSNYRVLDFGAGIGTFASMVKEKTSSKIECVEVDKSQAKIIAEKKIKVYSSHEDIPQKGFDFIYTFNVLEHIEDDLAAIKDLKEGLKDDGRLLIYLPAFQSLYSSFDKKIGHFRRYTKKDLAQKLKKAGFKIDKLEYADSLGFFAAFAFKLLDNGKGEINILSIKIYDLFIFPVSNLLDFIFKPFIGKNLLAIVRK